MIKEIKDMINLKPVYSSLTMHKKIYFDNIKNVYF